MHEVSLATRILECVLALSRENGDLPVRRVTIQMGALQQVVPEALTFAFQAAAQETRAAGAVLEYQEIPLQIACTQCRLEYPPDGLFWACPQCGAVGGRILQGNELTVHTVELEDEINSDGEDAQDED